MPTESFLENTLPFHCFKESKDSRRWILYTATITYAFTWSHLIYSTIDSAGSHITLHISSHEIHIKGMHLDPIHTAIVKESLYFIRMAPLALMPHFHAEDTIVQYIKILDASNMVDT